MEQDQGKPESNGPNPPTQVDKVSTSEVNKPDGNITTELAEAKKDAGPPTPAPQPTLENEGLFLFVDSQSIIPCSSPFLFSFISINTVFF